MALTHEQIRSVYAKRRVKGEYEEKLTELYESDEPAVDVAESWPANFASKNAGTLYQGFQNAAKKLEIADAVDILNRDGHVFIMVKSRCEEIVEDQMNGNGATPAKQ